MSFTHYTNDLINDTLFSKRASFDDPSAGGPYIAFFSGDPSAIGTDGTELSFVNGYPSTRVQAKETQFQASASSVIDNDDDTEGTGDIVWPQCTGADWASISTVGIVDHATNTTYATTPGGSNVVLLAFRKLSPSKTVTVGDTAKILQTNLTVTMRNDDQ